MRGCHCSPFGRSVDLSVSALTTLAPQLQQKLGPKDADTKSRLAQKLNSGAEVNIAFLPLCVILTRFSGEHDGGHSSIEPSASGAHPVETLRMRLPVTLHTAVHGTHEHAEERRWFPPTGDTHCRSIATY